jgi:hypothetical protein
MTDPKSAADETREWSRREDSEIDQTADSIVGSSVGVRKRGNLKSVISSNVIQTEELTS